MFIFLHVANSWSARVLQVCPPQMSILHNCVCLWWIIHISTSINLISAARNGSAGYGYMTIWQGSEIGPHVAFYSFIQGLPAISKWGIFYEAGQRLLYNQWESRGAMCSGRPTSNDCCRGPNSWPFSFSFCFHLFFSLPLIFFANFYFLCAHRIS